MSRPADPRPRRRRHEDPPHPAGAPRAAAGQVLTALHVVAGASAITLTFPDGSTSAASIVSRQPESDIALLQPDDPPAQVVPATLGNPRAMQIGSEAYIVG